MKSEEAIIDDAFEASLGKLFSVFFESYALAAEGSGKQEAENHFRNGLHSLRLAHSRAKELLK